MIVVRAFNSEDCEELEGSTVDKIQIFVYRFANAKNIYAAWI